MVLPFSYACHLLISIKCIVLEKSQKPTDVVRVRMSPEHAKVTTMLLKKNIKKYEEQAKTSINLPAEMYSRLGLDSIDDW